MAGELRIEVTGVKSTRKKMEQLRGLVRSAIIEDMAVLVKDVEADAKRRVPKKTGNLQRTITSEVEERKREPIGLVGANTNYAERLEDPENRLKHRSRKGFIGKPTPYLIPALNKNLRKIAKGIGEAVKKGIRRAT